MKYDSSQHHRRSIRLKGYDYSQAGAYFVTICINQGLHALGKIRNSRIYPSQSGEMVQTVWDELPLHYPGIAVDAFVLMPNHVHGIIVLRTATTEVGATTGGLPLQMGDRFYKPMTLGNVVHRFKSLTTAKYRHGVIQLGWTPFPKRFWQRNYYERIIRDEKSWEKIRGYILNNPIAWEFEASHLEKYHPHPDL
ncbi:MAG TPA: transposase [Chroococcales cyanobacterium]